MRKQYWILIFLIVLCIHVLGIVAGNELTGTITKPFLVLILAGYFFQCTKRVSSVLKKWILLALFFSWAGDILLQFVSTDATFFLAGLASFLIAHIFYILFFHAVRMIEAVHGKPFLLIPVLLYYVVLMVLLSPHLGDLKLPVRLYGIVICFMLLLAMHMPYIRDKMTGRLLLVGALLFVLSDSVLAINKFYSAFDGADILIMLTYGIAQLLITEGAIRYIESASISTKGIA